MLESEFLLSCEVIFQIIIWWPSTTCSGGEAFGAEESKCLWGHDRQGKMLLPFGEKGQAPLLFQVINYIVHIQTNDQMWVLRLRSVQK